MKKLFSLLCVTMLAMTAWGATVTDVITAADLAATGNSYVDFSGVKKNTAVYAGNSAKNSNGAIQLRSKNSNSGIVSTTSGGKLVSVKITVESGTNAIDVYGSNTAYTAASNLYSGAGNNQGTKLGSTSETATITVEGDYEYVGIRSNSGAIYISSIEITWETEGGTTPVEPEITKAANLAAANALNDNTDFTFTGDAVVTYHNGKYLFLRDNSGYGLIYYATAPAENFANGAVLSQNWTATKVTYKSLVEYSNPANVTASGVSNSALAAVQEIEASQMADMINAYVKINHVKSISGTTATLTDGTTIALYNRFTGVTIPEFTDQDCSITGIVSIYNDALQLYFIESDYNAPVTPVEGTTYTLVTNVADLAAGDKIILVNNEAAKAMGAAKTNNYGAVAVEINNNVIVTSEANEITLEAQDNNWALKTADGYLYAASSSSNHLKAKAEVDSNAIAAISISTDGASIIFQGANTRNNLRYNSSSDLFSCYASGQQPVFIYKAGEGPVVAAPTINPNGGAFTGSQVVELTCSTDGAQIYYSTDDENYTLYNAAFTINQSCTVYAYAMVGDDKSSTVNAKFTKRAEVSTLAEANALSNKTDFVFYGNVVVVYQNGSNLWVKDDSGYGLIYGNQVPAVEVGATLNEEWDAQYYLFRGHINEYQYPNNVTASDEPLQTIVATEYTEAALDTTKINERVIVKGLTLTADEDVKYLYTANGMAIYNQFNITYPTIEEGKTYDVEGMVSYYNNAVQIMPIAITEAAAPAGLRGDVDGSENVNIADVTALIDYLLSGNAEGVVVGNADCNVDQAVNIADVTALIDFLLSGNWSE